MDGGQDQIVLVEQRDAGLVAGRVRRIERQLGEEALARRIAAGDLLELDQVGAPCLGVFVSSFQVRFVPEPGAFEIRRPVRMAVISATAATNAFQSSPARRRGWRRASAAIGSAPPRYGRARAAPRSSRRRDQVHQPKAGHAVARVLDKTQQRQHVLDVGGIEEFQAAEFHEGDIAAGQFDFQRTAVAGGPKQHRLLFQQCAASRFSSTRSTMQRA